MKVEEFINPKQGNMSVEEYSLNFSRLSKNAPSLVSNRMGAVSWFVIGIADLVKEKCCTTILHNHMNLYRPMVYTNSIEESKFKRYTRNFKRSGPSEKK